ncbi:putative F-box domain-containing protein [Helianthus annuus]|nr:putative F-box domain-containing protein [Helianthus annuus]KAJ0680386.1 putative F-box domain-containing protein [Helianthus annuus]KAJ0834201.1 putative F-box domain-containing protein [Helianthus annuus]
MSANIPFEIQEEIIKRVLPVKSLIRFRSVSKQWKSLIESSEFITEHSVNPTQANHLLITYVVVDYRSKVEKYVSIVDDDSFPHHQFSPDVPPYPLWRPHVFGCSHGLVCLLDPILAAAIVWNPSVRKAVGIELPDARHAFGFGFGFGVCPRTFDPKIVKISEISHMITAEVFFVKIWGLEKHTSESASGS